MYTVKLGITYFCFSIRMSIENGDKKSGDKKMMNSEYGQYRSTQGEL